MIAVAPARLEEQAACLALLPEVWNVPAELIAARAGGAIVGAAALVWESWSQPAGFPLAVHVLPHARRSGVGRALVAAARRMIDGETDGLWSIGNLAEHGDAAAFLRACGFAPCKRISHFEVDVATFHDHLERIVARLRRGGRIPDDARAVALRDAPLDEVAWLVGREFPGGPARLLNRLTHAHAHANAAGGVGPSGGIDLDRSTVIIEGSQVAGALLYQWNAGHPVIEANVVAPAWRNTYVNALQLQVATKNGLEGGATHFRFDSDSTVRDSMNLARRGDARLLRVDARFYAAIAAG